MDEWQLCHYAIYMADRVIAHGTVTNYISRVNNLQHLAGYPTMPPGSPNLKLVMDGLKAYLARPVKQAQPITFDIITDISEIVNRNNDFELCICSCSDRILFDPKK